MCIRDSMQGGEISGLVPTIGLFLVKAGGALIDNMALLFAIGVGVGMSDAVSYTHLTIMENRSELYRRLWLERKSLLRM